MALKILQPGIQPLGQFDGYDSEYLLTKGGEVGTFIGVPLASDRAAKDADGSDGYVNNMRPAVTITLASGTRPLFLIDDGIEGYGTVFGSVIGGIAGQNVSGTQLGPHTATGSGKLTIWDKPGLYAVTLDAVDTDAADGLVPTNLSLSVGDPLYATAAGLLTPDSAKQFEAVVVGRFVNFEANGSLVTTPHSLVSPLTESKLRLTQAVFSFSPPAG
jgi:hypothetical protein